VILSRILNKKLTLFTGRGLQPRVRRNKDDFLEKGTVTIFPLYFCILSDKEKEENTQAVNEDFSGRWFGINEALIMLQYEDDKKLVSFLTH